MDQGLVWSEKVEGRCRRTQQNQDIQREGDRIMRVAAKPVLIGVPVVMATVLAVVLALWAWGPIGLAVPTSNAGLVWNVEYWHRNAEGEVLQHKKESNAIVASGLEHAMERLIAELDADAALAFSNPAATQIGTANAFDQIVLMNADDAASDGLLAASVLLLVDGTNNADAAHVNPADGTYTNIGDTTDGDGKVVVTFLAQGNPAAATQMHLVKAPFDDTVGGTLAIVAADVLATIEITVDLADTDTLQVDWTINIS